MNELEKKVCGFKIICKRLNKIQRYFAKPSERDAKLITLIREYVVKYHTNVISEFLPDFIIDEIFILKDEYNELDAKYKKLIVKYLELRNLYNEKNKIN